MKTTIVCGILGAGKTSFIRNILDHGSSRTVVLVNDFGSAGIDGEILSAGGIETIELKSGCVCCSLRFELVTTIEKVVSRFQPERLFIEPSGVASPTSVLEVLETMKFPRPTVVGIVDATDFIEAYDADMYGWFFKSQVAQSDIVLINKKDLVQEEKIEKTVRLVSSLNQNAVIIPAVHAVINREVLENTVPSAVPYSGSEHPFEFETVSIPLDAHMTLASMKQLFSRLSGSEVGTVVRAKALVQTDQGPYRFDLASKQVNAEAFDTDIKNSRLVVIGTNLQEDAIRELAC